VLLRPGEILGLPAGVPDPIYDLAYFRYLLVLLAALMGVASLRRRLNLAILAGVLLAVASVGFWLLVFRRPYGLFFDTEATRWAAQVSVAVASGNAREAFLVGEPARGGAFLFVLGRASGRLLLLLPSLLPLFVLPTLGVLILGLWAQRDLAPFATVLLLAFSTGDLDCLRGWGFLPGLWSHATTSLGVLGGVGMVLVAGRLARRPWWMSGGLVAAVTGTIVLLSGSGPKPTFADALFLLTVDQGPWFVLGAWGLIRGAESSARLLLAIGAVLVALAGLSHVDPWGGHAVYRIGLILAATGPLSTLCVPMGEMALRYGFPKGLAETPGSIGRTLLLLVFVPCSFLVWWDPAHLDPAARASLDPVSPVISEAMGWIRKETPADAVFLASPDYSPYVAVLAGRRVLRAPSLALASDEESRVRAERILSGQGEELVEPYRLRWIFIAPGDFRSRGIRTPRDLDGKELFHLRYHNKEGFRVYEIAPKEPARPSHEGRLGPFHAPALSRVE